MLNPSVLALVLVMLLSSFGIVDAADRLSKPSCVYIEESSEEPWSVIFETKRGDEIITLQRKDEIFETFKFLVNDPYESAEGDIWYESSTGNSWVLQLLECDEGASDIFDCVSYGLMTKFLVSTSVDSNDYQFKFYRDFCE